MKIVSLGKIAKKQGFRIGDDVLSIDGYKVQDQLDYLYYDNEEKFVVDIIRDGKKRAINVKKKAYESLELEFDVEMKPKVCRNHCIFCFVDQLPHGMRESLYVKDDDYRFSFLCGSYVTMTNVSEEDIERIIRLKLSPLYISVHAWNDDVRAFMLKNPNTRKLREQMTRLGKAGIKMHTQLVVVPGINDGKVLEDSIRGLHDVEGVVSVAVVPVGLTGHRDNLNALKLVDEENARQTIELVEKLHVELDGFCWCSDEYYVIAGLSVKDSKYYGSFDQIENGVGLLADFDDNFYYSLDECENMTLNKHICMITGVAFAPILSKRAKELETKLGITCEVKGIVNKFFGESVTVAGLITATDIISQVAGTKADAFMIPDNMLREFCDTFLDNTTVKEVEEKLGAPLIVVSHNGSDMINKIVEFAKQN